MPSKKRRKFSALRAEQVRYGGYLTYEFVFSILSETKIPLHDFTYLALTIITPQKLYRKLEILHKND